MNTTANAGIPAGKPLDYSSLHPVSKNSAIPETDLAFCEQEQALLYEALDKIGYWYGFFCREAGQYREACRLSFAPDGRLNYGNYSGGHDSRTSGYERFLFKPFDTINRLVESRMAAISAFAGNITGYFNRKYSISVPVPEVDAKKLTPGFRPAYTDYTSLVEKYLQGRGFLRAATEGIISRFRETVCLAGRQGHAPRLQSDRIVFHDVILFDEFYSRLNKNHIHYDYRNRLHVLCEGIAFGATGSLHGDASMIRDFDDGDVDTAGSYPLACGAAVGMKFYKNGRIDVRFSSPAMARNCFLKLQLDDFDNLNSKRP